MQDRSCGPWQDCGRWSRPAPPFGRRRASARDVADLINAARSSSSAATFGFQSATSMTSGLPPVSNLESPGGWTLDGDAFSWNGENRLAVPPLTVSRAAKRLVGVGPTSGAAGSRRRPSARRDCCRPRIAAGRLIPAIPSRQAAYTSPPRNRNRSTSRANWATTLAFDACDRAGDRTRSDRCPEWRRIRADRSIPCRRMARG